MKYLTKIMCSLFNDREVTLGMITNNFLKAFTLAVVWNLFGLGFVKDMNLIPTMFTVLYGGFIYLSFVILFVFAICLVAYLLFFIQDRTSSKLDDIKDTVIFKCKK
jgi:apolipoprotein N-acyltransferase